MILFLFHVMRLSPLRRVVGTLVLRFEMYIYYNSPENRSYIIMGFYIWMFCLLLPWLLLIFINEFIISYFVKYYFKYFQNDEYDIMCFHERYISISNKNKNNININMNQNNIFRILSYNIQSGKGTDGKLDIKRQCNVINSISPDIVCLQEVEYMNNQCKNIANLCNFNYYQTLATRNKINDSLGIGICSKYPIIDTKTFEYKQWLFRYKRKAIAIKIKIPIYQNIINKNIKNNNNTKYIKIWIVNTHLQNDITFEETFWQVQHLVTFCDKLGMLFLSAFNLLSICFETDLS